MRGHRPRLRRRLTTRGLVAVAGLIATLCAIWSVATFSLAPPFVRPRQLTIGVAATHVMLDVDASLIADKHAPYRDLPTVTQRATIFGGLIASVPLEQRIAARMGVPVSELAAIPRLTADVQRTMREPDLETRANQILGSRAPYRLDLQADQTLPLLHIYSQAPTPAEAIRLADVSVQELRTYLATVAARRKLPIGDQLRVVQLGQARGGIANSRSAVMIGGLTWLVAFAAALWLIFGVRAVRRGWVAAADAQPADHPPELPLGVPARRQAPPLQPGTVGRVLRRRTTPRQAIRTIASAEGDWPRTTRIMPWLIAVFLVILWLVPFNVIELTASLPFDLKFDRLVLPILFAVWALSLAVGGPDRPRMRPTVIHVAIGGLILVTLIGVVLDARYLNHTLELNLSVKRMTLLVSYGLLFLMVASTVRRSEVQAFMRFTLRLAVLCAIGVIWEYRFHTNVFHNWSDAILPGFFRVGFVDPNAVDDIGRRMVQGPAEHPLETVAMLTMAIPIAIVGIIHSRERRERVLYAIAACVLLAACIATYRKSALLAPAAAVLTIAWFRRSDLLRLAPLAALSVVAVHVLSPGALGSVLGQLQPSKFGVNTVSDRTADYDAIRPDVWTHLAFGRGYGSYDHTSYRVLDSEVLSRLVDSGVLGLLALFLLPMLIIAAARPIIHARNAVWSPVALAVSASAVAFLVLAFLFDVTSFPHTPYILMSLAGFLAVIVRDASEPSRDAERTATPARRPATAAARGGARRRHHPTLRA